MTRSKDDIHEKKTGEQAESQRRTAAASRLGLRQSASVTVSPDRSKFLKPRIGDPLSEYLKSVRTWHGYIRFVSMPQLRFNPDTPIDRLFIEPKLATRHLTPDMPIDQWQGVLDLEQTLVESPRLVVLGDPGSGKSTLVNWVAWHQARQVGKVWRPELEGLVPLPIVLREISIRRGLTWDKLIAAFLDHQMCQGKLDAATVEQMMQTGQALLLLDGLDEIGNWRLREELQQVVFEAMDRYPRTRWLMTSRLVGYDEMPFHEDFENPQDPDYDPVDDLSEPPEEHLPEGGHPRPRRTMAELVYVAPFDDAQIQRFAFQWFAEREPARERAYRQADEFFRRLQEHETTRRLARTPNLLTMMALIYRIKARLPHGRAVLYDEIAAAYLQSIDEYRGLHTFDYTLETKKKWLAYVGFQMQQRRAVDRNEKDEKNKNDDGEILADKQEVIGWIGEAMQETGKLGDAAEAAAFVDYIGRRSGLLLPRGVDQFAFMHLSFQEYFAACFIKDRLASYARVGRTTPGCGPDDLARYANQQVWQETLIFLFELSAEETDGALWLLNMIYGPQLASLDELESDRFQAVSLLAQLTIDPHSGFTRDDRRQADETCIRWALAMQQGQRNFSFWIFPQFIGEWLLVTLLSADEPRKSELLAQIAAVAAESDVRRLILTSSPLTDISPLCGLTGLQTLRLTRTPVTDLSPLAGLQGLEQLSLGSTPVTDLAPLSGLTGLRQLWLDDTPVTDISPLSGLTGLQELDLSGTSVMDLSPLSGLTGLRKLRLDGTPVTDLSPLSGLTELHHLDLRGTQVTDLSPLARLTKTRISLDRDRDISVPEQMKNRIDYL